MSTDTKLLEFLKATFQPDHENFPGYLSIRCRLLQWGTREIERGYSFQFDQERGKLYLLVSASNARLPVADAPNVQDAIEAAKAFLTKWLGDDLEFEKRIDDEILRLEAEKRPAEHG